MNFDPLSFESLKFKVHGRDLSTPEFEKLTAFIFAITQAQVLKQVNVLYRGESYSNLKEKLNMKGSTPDYQKLNDFIFLIGEKGRAYQKEYRKKVKFDHQLFSVSDTSSLVFKYIFQKFNQALKLDKSAVRHFKNSNSKFSGFFLDDGNEKHFVQKVGESPKKQLIEIRDYYLMPLHHLGSVGYYNNSILLSTSTDKKVAINFARSRGERHSVIFISWVSRKKPFPVQRKTSISVGKYDLPTYKTSFYPHQSETSLKGGILPHYLIGYVKDDWEMELNPNLFSTQNEFKQILQNGFEIDQIKFGEKLKETNYTVYFTVDEMGNYRDHLL
jgi:hypothetical protein